MRKLLEKISKEKLIDFLVEYAENDANFVNALNVRFRKPEFEEELGKIKSTLRWKVCLITAIMTAGAAYT